LLAGVEVEAVEVVGDALSEVGEVALPALLLGEFGAALLEGLQFAGELGAASIDVLAAGLEVL